MCSPIVAFKKVNAQGIGNFELCEIRSLSKPLQMPGILNPNLVWHASGNLTSKPQVRPSFSGYMQTVSKGERSGVYAVEFLSINDLNPSDNDCMYSTLMYIVNQARLIRMSPPNVTFDQSLYIKAFDIAMKAGLNDVIRFGGSHTLMSFLGAISHLMRGSGREEMLGVLYGSNTVEHV